MAHSVKREHRGQGQVGKPDQEGEQGGRGPHDFDDPTTVPLWVPSQRDPLPLDETDPATHRLAFFDLYDMQPEWTPPAVDVEPVERVRARVKRRGPWPVIVTLFFVAALAVGAGVAGAAIGSSMAGTATDAAVDEATSEGQRTGVEAGLRDGKAKGTEAGTVAGAQVGATEGRTAGAEEGKAKGTSIGATEGGRDGRSQAGWGSITPGEGADAGVSDAGVSDAGVSDADTPDVAEKDAATTTGAAPPAAEQTPSGGEGE